MAIKDQLAVAQWEERELQNFVYLYDNELKKKVKTVYEELLLSRQWKKLQYLSLHIVVDYKACLLLSRNQTCLKQGATVS